MDIRNIDKAQRGTVRSRRTRQAVSDEQYTARRRARRATCARYACPAVTIILTLALVVGVVVIVAAPSLVRARNAIVLAALGDVAGSLRYDALSVNVYGSDIRNVTYDDGRLCMHASGAGFRQTPFDLVSTVLFSIRAATLYVDDFELCAPTTSTSPSMSSTSSTSSTSPPLHVVPRGTRTASPHRLPFPSPPVVDSSSDVAYVPTMCFAGVPDIAVRDVRVSMLLSPWLGAGAIVAGRGTGAVRGSGAEVVLRAELNAPSLDAGVEGDLHILFGRCVAEATLSDASVSLMGRTVRFAAAAAASSTESKPTASFSAELSVTPRIAGASDVTARLGFHADDAGTLVGDVRVDPWGRASVEYDAAARCVLGGAAVASPFVATGFAELCAAGGASWAGVACATACANETVCRCRRAGPSRLEVRSRADGGVAASWRGAAAEVVARVGAKNATVAWRAGDASATVSAWPGPGRWPRAVASARLDEDVVLEGSLAEDERVRIEHDGRLGTLLARFGIPLPARFRVAHGVLGIDLRKNAPSVATWTTDEVAVTIGDAAETMLEARGVAATCPTLAVNLTARADWASVGSFAATDVAAGCAADAASIMDVGLWEALAASLEIEGSVPLFGTSKRVGGAAWIGR